MLICSRFEVENPVGLYAMEKFYDRFYFDGCRRALGKWANISIRKSDKK